MNNLHGPKQPRARLRALVLAGAVVLAGCIGQETPAALLAKAQSALAEGDIRTAEIHLKNLLQQEDSAEARTLLGEMYRRVSDHRSAEKELRRALELGGDRTRALPALLDTLVQLGQFRQALELGRDLALDMPTAQAAALTALARAHAGLGDPAQARAHVEKALASDPNHVPARVAGVLLDVGRDRAAALARIEEILANAPDSIEALTAKGELEFAAGNFAGARTPLETVAARQPGNAAVRALLTTVEVELRDYPAARKRWSDLERVAPGSPGTLYLRATIELREQQYGEARRAVEELLKVAPDFLPGIALAGNVYLALNLLEQAETHARRVIERAPGAAQGHRLLGATLLRMNAPGRALEAVGPVIERGARDATLYAIAGEAALRLNEIAKADAYFAEAARLDPQDAGKRTGLALAKLAAGERVKGYAELEEAVRLDTGSHRADLALILSRMRDRDFDKALAAIAALAEKLPGSPIPANLRGMALAGKRDLAGARTAFEQALGADPMFFPAAANLAALDVSEGRPGEARKRYEALLARDARHQQALLALAAHNTAQGGSRSDTLELLRRARAGNPGEIGPVLALADFHLRGDAPREAIAILQEGLAAHAGNVALLDRLGTAHLRLGENVQAIATFEQILRINPNSPQLQHRMGEVRSSLKDYAGALGNFRKAAELNPKGGESWRALALALLQLGRGDEARATAAAMRREIPEHPLSLAIEGDLEAAQQRWPQAAAAYRKALASARQPHLAVRLHQALVRAGKPDDADAVLATWFAATPDDVAVRLYAGELEIARKRWQQAIGHYERVIAKAPNNVAALNNYAWALNQLKDPRALKYAEEAVALAPGAAPVMDTLGTVLTSAGQHARAIAVLRQAVELAPKTTEYRLHLAQALAAAGDRSAAKKELEVVLRDATPGAIADQAKELAAKL